MGRRTSAMINVSVNLRLPSCTSVCCVPYDAMELPLAATSLGAVGEG